MDNDKCLEAIAWDPRDHLDVPGLAYGLSRYGGRWFDISISVDPGEQDALESLDKVFTKLREIVISEKPDIDYFTLDLRVASRTAISRPR